MSGWTDYIADWSSKDKLRLCSVYDALSALVAAVNERGSVLSSYTPLPAVNRLHPVKYYVDLIDAKIKSIVPQFVNHTVNSGDFSGLEAIPMWTWNDILDGETEASINRLYPVLDWVYQRYEIINKLRWITNNAFSDVRTKGEIKYIYYRHPNVNKETPEYWASFIETRIHSYSFTNGSTSGAYIENICEDLDGQLFYYNGELNFTYEKTLSYGSGQIIGILHSFELQYYIQKDIEIPQELKASYDLYVSTGGLWWPYNDGSYVFDGVSFDSGENKYSSGNERSFPFLTEIIGDSAQYPITAQWQYHNGSYSCKSGSYLDSSVKFILKFTGSNGFQFRDW